MLIRFDVFDENVFKMNSNECVASTTGNCSIYFHSSDQNLMIDVFRKSVSLVRLRHKSSCLSSQSEEARYCNLDGDHIFKTIDFRSLTVPML